MADTAQDIVCSNNTRATADRHPLKQLAAQFRRRLKRERESYTPDEQDKAQSVENFLSTLTADKCRAMATPSIRADALQAIDEFAATLPSAGE